MSVSSVSIFTLFWSAFFGILCTSLSFADAQDSGPFSDNAERTLRSGVEQFSQSQRQDDLNGALYGDRINPPIQILPNRRLDAGLARNVLRREGGFSDNLQETNQNGDGRFEIRGGERPSFDLDVERAARRRQQQLDEKMTVRGGDDFDAANQRRRGGNAQDQEIDINDNDIAELEGRDGRQEAGRADDQAPETQDENRDNQFEEDFLRAERDLEQNEGNNQQRRAGRLDRANDRRGRRAGQLAAGRQNATQRRQNADNLDPDPNDITGSIRPNADEDIYAQEGKRLGSFLFFPEITISGLYSDNPTAAPANRPGDTALEFVPRFLLRSDWARHQLEFEGQLTKSYFSDLTSENVEEWFLSSRTRLDIQNNHFLELEGRIENLQDDRGEIDNLNTDAELATFQTLNLNGLYNYGWNRSSLQLRGGLTDYDYDDVTNSQGVVTNNDDRDYLESSASARLNHTFNPGFSVFSQADYVVRDFDSRLDDQGFQRGANGYSFEVGGIYDMSALWRFEASVGHEWLDADEARYVDIKEVVYNAALTYRPTETTTLVLRTERDVESTDLDGTIGVVETDYSVILTHYFRPHIRFVGSLVYEEEEFEGVDVEQDTLTAGIAMQYILNNRARVLASYEFSDVDTNDGAGYQENVFRIGLNLRP